MLPNDTLASQPVASPFLYPDSLPFSQARDYELGGIAIADPSQGIDKLPWAVQLESNGDVFIYKLLEGPGTSAPVLNLPDASWIGLTFDRNMNYILSWYEEELGNSYLYWYDPVVAGYVTTTFAGVRCPRVCHDDKREEASTWDDVLFFYLTADNKLAYRQQRDRYEIERILAGSLTPQQKYLTRVGMGTNMRVQIEFSSWKGA